jgi:peptide/nickel transport system ATP-binding protein
VVQLEHDRAVALDSERVDAWDCLPAGLTPQGKALLSCQSVSVALASSGGKWRKMHAAQVLHAVSFELGWGETLAMVGATPSGKSTLALALAGVLQPTLGRAVVRHRNSDRRRSGPGASRLRAVQLCFDDPKGALDPRMTAHQLMVEALLIAGWERNGVDRTAEEALQTFGLATASERRPPQLSSGEACLLSLARALSLRPAVLLLDNALAALDRARRASVLGLLRRRCAAHASQVLITNDLSLAHEASDHLGVLYGGTLVEWGATRQVFAKPAHPYARALLPQMDREKLRLQLLLEGAPPDPRALPSGCVFHPRCARFAEGRCDRDEPELRELVGDRGHKVACFRPHD